MQLTGIRATFAFLAAALGTLPIAKAAILDFPVTPVTDGIYVIYGPKELRESWLPQQSGNRAD